RRRPGTAPHRAGRTPPPRPPPAPPARDRPASSRSSARSAAPTAGSRPRPGCHCWPDCHWPGRIRCPVSRLARPLNLTHGTRLRHVSLVYARRVRSHLSGGLGRRRGAERVREFLEIVIGSVPVAGGGGPVERVGVPRVGQDVP